MPWLSLGLKPKRSRERKKWCEKKLICKRFIATYHHDDRHTYSIPCSVRLVLFSKQFFLSLVFLKREREGKNVRNVGNYILLRILFDFFNYLINESLWFKPQRAHEECWKVFSVGNPWIYVLISISRLLSFFDRHRPNCVVMWWDERLIVLNCSVSCQWFG